VDTSLLLGLTRSPDEAAQLPADYEPLIVTGETLQPLELIEDEVLLALPYIPTHPEDVCRIQTQFPEHAQAQAHKDNPFQLLSQLKKGLH
jgi:uncharacterized protein